MSIFKLLSNRDSSASQPVESDIGGLPELGVQIYEMIVNEENKDCLPEVSTWLMPEQEAKPEELIGQRLLSYDAKLGEIVSADDLAVLLEDDKGFQSAIEYGVSSGNTVIHHWNYEADTKLGKHCLSAWYAKRTRIREANEVSFPRLNSDQIGILVELCGGDREAASSMARLLPGQTVAFIDIVADHYS